MTLSQRTLSHLVGAHAFKTSLAPLRSIEWLVYAKRPFAGPDQVLAYLARYTHQVAISNHRLVAIGDGRVTFTWRDYRDAAKIKHMALTADEFIRRFLLHVLPDGFQRIRHYGFLANGHRRSKLAQIRRLINAMPAATDGTSREGETERVGEPPEWQSCPCCGGRMMIIEILPGPRQRRLDSS
jgi:hypothetical protein